jgi:hypothetical protein
MGLRFRRSIRVLPGVRLNIGKPVVSVCGAHVTIGHGHVRKTVRLAGTGLSYTTTRRITASRPAPVADGMRPASRIPRVAILLVVLMVLGAVAVAVLLSRYFGLSSG